MSFVFLCENCVIFCVELDGHRMCLCYVQKSLSLNRELSVFSSNANGPHAVR